MLEGFKDQLDKIAAEFATAEDAEAECQRIAHACQTAIGFLNGNGADRGECSPKHLRVGVDSAMVDNGALALALITAGVISESQYMAARVMLWRREIALRTEKAQQRAPGVTFG